MQHSDGFCGFVQFPKANEGSLDLIEEQLSFWGGLQSVLVSFKKLEADFLFKFQNQPADRRLGNKEEFAGQGEAARTKDRLKGF